MDPQMLTSGVGIVIVIFVVILSILWFILPFAIFGIKKRLDRLIEQNDELIILQRMRSNKSDNSRPGDKGGRIEPTLNL